MYVPRASITMLLPPALVPCCRSGVITSMALASVNKFLLYGFIAPDSPRAYEAANRIVAAATACRFEPTSTQEDESTLMRLLELLGNCVRSSIGVLLTDAHVWGAAQCCFRIACMDRCSHLLQRMSQTALTQTVLQVFSRVHAIMEASAAGAPLAVVAANGRAQQLVSQRDPSSSRRSERGSLVAAGHMHRKAPYGAPVLGRLMEWLAGLIAPRAHTRGTRVMALEVRGHAVLRRTLASLCTQD
jgi:hypothetical protein